MRFEEILPEIRKGRRFRFVKYPDWMDKGYVLVTSLIIDPELQWELEPLPEKKVEITRSQLLQACERVNIKHIGRCTYINSNAMNFLLKELGLE